MVDTFLQLEGNFIQSAYKLNVLSACVLSGIKYNDLQQEQRLIS